VPEIALEYGDKLAIGNGPADSSGFFANLPRLGSNRRDRAPRERRKLCFEAGYPGCGENRVALSRFTP
jgi:hypothetical protein